MSEPVMCPNCGEVGIGRYCSACGQVKDPKLPSFGEWVSQTIDAVFNVDGRAARTVRALLLQPGQLTLHFLAGKRASYVPPIRLYLVCSILYFFVASFSDTTRFMFVQFEGQHYADAGLAAVLPRMMFVVVPVVALMSKLLYRRRGLPYAAHLIFVLHLFSFWYLTFSVDVFANPFVDQVFADDSIHWYALVPALISIAVGIWNQVYLFLALRRLHEEGVRSTIGKQLLFLLGFGFALALGILAFIQVRGWLYPAS